MEIMQNYSAIVLWSISGIDVENEGKKGARENVDDMEKAQTAVERERNSI